MSWLVFREPVSAWTHALGFLLTLVGLWVLWQRTRGLPPKRFAFTVFGVTMSVCYLGSTLYHAVRLRPEQIRWFATLDYIGIYLLIAGTITPVALIVLRGRWKWGTLGLAWFLAVAGIGLRLVYADIPPLLSTGLYVAMGWLALFAAGPLVRAMPFAGLMWLLAGGVAYTVGAIVFLFDSRARYLHFVWHLFVLAGTACHFFAALWYSAPSGA